MLAKTIYGNSLFQWSLTALIIIGAVVVGKVAYWLIGKTIKKMAARTKTHLDDILIDMAEEPVVVAIVILGIWYGLRRLTLPEAADSFINKTVAALLIINTAWLITRILDSMIKEYLVPLAEKTETELDDHVIIIIRRGIRISIWILAIIMAIEKTGQDVLSILTGLGIGGLAFALAAKDAVGNFFGSIAIFIDKPFRIGDRIQLLGYDGVVTSIGLRSTRIRTRYEGRIVNIPNVSVAAENIVNVDTENGRQIFSVYRLSRDMTDVQIELAMQILKRIAEDDPDTQEKVVTGFFAITEYSRDIMLLYWIKPEISNLKTRTRINLEIVRQFQAHNIELTKAQPVHTKMDQVELL